MRLDSGLHNRERVSVSELIDEIEVDASLEAAARGIGLTVAPVDRDLEVDVDRAILTAAVTNLLHNAFKFSHPKGLVSLRTSATPSQVMFDVEDECGGLPEGNVKDLFLPFTQRGRDRTGLGLGLSISQRGIVANGGEVLVRDLPGKGCIFTITLPRHP